MNFELPLRLTELTQSHAARRQTLSKRQIHDKIEKAADIESSSSFTSLLTPTRFAALHEMLAAHSNERFAPLLLAHVVSHNSDISTIADTWLDEQYWGSLRTSAPYVGDGLPLTTLPIDDVLWQTGRGSRTHVLLFCTLNVCCCCCKALTLSLSLSLSLSSQWCVRAKSKPRLRRARRTLRRER